MSDQAKYKIILNLGCINVKNRNKYLHDKQTAIWRKQWNKVCIEMNKSSL